MVVVFDAHFTQLIGLNSSEALSLFSTQFKLITQNWSTQKIEPLQILAIGIFGQPPRFYFFDCRSFRSQARKERGISTF